MNMPPQNASEGLEKFIAEMLVNAKEKSVPLTAFRKMLQNYGTKRAIEILISKDGIQSGLQDLDKAGLIKWSVEQAVLNFPSEFTKLEQKRASEKLESVEIFKKLSSKK